MIDSSSQMKFYLLADRLASGRRGKPTWRERVDPVARFQVHLRKAEHYGNDRRDAAAKLLFLYHWLRLNRLRVRLGFTIPLHVFGPGLSIAHYGTIVVNKKACIGANCRIHPGVCIGGLDGQNPVLGDNVYIGPGAKIYGGVRIGDDVAIGANAVVTTDVPPHVTVAGIPARIVSDRGSAGLIVPGSRLAQAKSINWADFQHAEVMADDHVNDIPSC